jgi:undecaprenyldiphospho-muramoylpentapeptide beta-N-acetylglucosaminyltransferase
MRGVTEPGSPVEPSPATAGRAGTAATAARAGTAATAGRAGTAATAATAQVVITGGGTGGHVYPALAIAAALELRGTPRTGIRFVGAQRGLEAIAVPEAGYAIDLLPGRGVRRSVRPDALRENLGALWGTARAVVRARRLLRRASPRVVVGVGGYASLPCVLAARLRRRPIPLVVHEQNAAPGVANRVAVRLGARAAVSLPDTGLRHAVVTGNPVRAELVGIRRPSTAELAARGPLVLAAFGGSLGARRINDAVLDLYDRWRHRTDVAVHHVCGPRNHADCLETLERRRRPGDTLDYTLVAYEHEMGALYGRAALAVCRAGAVTVAELAVVGLPAILVPLPAAPGDHQTRNAQSLALHGAALLLPDAECTADRLAERAGSLLAAPERLDAMSAACRALARPDAAHAVAALVAEAGELVPTVGPDTSEGDDA